MKKQVAKEIEKHVKPGSTLIMALPTEKPEHVMKAIESANLLGLKGERITDIFIHDQTFYFYGIKHGK